MHIQSFHVPKSHSCKSNAYPPNTQELEWAPCSNLPAASPTPLTFPAVHTGPPQRRAWEWSAGWWTS